ATKPSHLVRSERENITPIKQHLSRGWFEQSQDRTADSGLATTRLSDQPEGVPLRYGKGYTVDRPYVANSRRYDSAPDGIMLDQIFYDDEIVHKQMSVVSCPWLVARRL